MISDISAGFTPLSAGYDPGDLIDRSIMATRGAVFPHHGLSPTG